MKHFVSLIWLQFNPIVGNLTSISTMISYHPFIVMVRKREKCLFISGNHELINKENFVYWHRPNNMCWLEKSFKYKRLRRSLSESLFTFQVAGRTLFVFLMMQQLRISHLRRQEFLNCLCQRKFVLLFRNLLWSCCFWLNVGMLSDS